MTGPVRVLFVCLGNICRSPTAEVVFADAAAAAGLQVEVDSAGTGDWHLGAPPHPPAIEAARRRGYDLTALRARQVTAADATRFDVIIAMDRANQRDLARLLPGASVSLMLDHGPDKGFQDVPDPYFTDDYEATLDLIEEASAALVAQLAQKVEAVSPKA